MQNYRCRGLARIVAAVVLTQWLALYALHAQSQGVMEPIVEGYRGIEWTDLIPPDDLEALMNPPDYLDELTDGATEEQIMRQVQAAIEQAGDSRYQEALVSTRVVADFDGQTVSIPGFIVPLEFGSGQNVTKFLIVPYFGACVHMPAPPPNQVIYAEYDKGFELDDLYEPFWVSGILRTAMTENELAKSVYAIDVAQLDAYEE